MKKASKRWPQSLNFPAVWDSAGECRHKGAGALLLRGGEDLLGWALLDNPSLKSTGATYLTTRATGAPFLDDGSNIQCQNAYNMKYWFPIPQKERDINANLPQNPGW